MLVPPALPAGSLASRPQPVLSGGGLTLRPWDAADASVLVAAYADPEIQRWHVRSMTSAEATDWVTDRSGRWAREVGGEWAVTADGAVSGRVGLRSIVLAEGLAEVAYWVLPPARGAGVASRAVEVLSRWCFDDTG